VQAGDANTPFLSVVIPTHDRPERLASCLEALARQDLPKQRFEVIVVDDGSPRSPTQAVEAVGDRLQTTLLRQARSGPAGARNAGAGRARGALLAFTDDDCEPAPGWLTALADAASRAPGAGIGGFTHNVLVDNLFSSASQMLVDHLYDVFNPDPDDARFFTSNNLALPTEAFRQLGGFAESFPLPAGEDRELCDRWRHAGLRLTFAPTALIDHLHALDLMGFLRQHFRYGRGAQEFRRLRAQRGERVDFEGVSFYLRLILRPFSREPFARALALSGLLFVTQVANTAGFLWQHAVMKREDSRMTAERS
jgi:glycosyltransferase involved in cell wall biosynthesis